MTTAKFWKAAAERAVKTAAQTALATLGASAFDVLTVDWQAVASVSAGGAILSLLTSVASSKVGNDGPSVTDAETLE